MRGCVYFSATLDPLSRMRQLLGGTDSRYYGELSPSRSVYRFTGLRSDSRWGGAHKADERIACDILADNVKFYEKLIRRYGARS